MPTDSIPLSDRIRTLQTELNASRDLLIARTKELNDTPDDDALTQVIEGLEAEVSTKEKSLRRLMENEQRLAKMAAPIGHNGGPTILPARQAEFKPSADLFIRGAVCAFQAFYERRSAMDVAAERYKDDEVTAYMVAMTTKAAQAPATTFTPGYAAELVRQTYAAWMDSLKTVAVLPRMPFRSENFDDGSPIIFPGQLAQAAYPANFEAMWRKEGDPIRVGSLSMTSMSMRPYSAGVIGHFTKELLKRSSPNIESMIRETIIDDTGRAMDAYFFSASPAVTDVRPPGIANGLNAPDTRAQTGVTAAAVEHDLRDMVNTMLITRRIGRNPIWAMHSLHASALGTVQNNITGAPVYPGMGSITSGSLLGFPVYAGLAMPTDRLYLIDAAYVGFAGGTPSWEVSDQATIHEESQTPLPIGTAGTPAVVAAPVRSLYQTHSAAVKAVYELSWIILRQGAVQQLTGVTWGSGGITPNLETLLSGQGVGFDREASSRQRREAAEEAEKAERDERDARAAGRTGDRGQPERDEQPRTRR